MDKVVARKLRPWEGRMLHRLKRQLANTVNNRHARVILLSRGGQCNRQIAERVGYTPAWVRRIIRRFNDGGLDAITWYPYFCNPGNPRRFVAQIAERIAEVALSPARQLIGMSVWSLAKLREYLIEQGIIDSICLEWLRQILRRQRIRWRHTKTWKESNDPEFWPKYRRIRRLYDRAPAEGTRLSLDEFGPLNLQPRHGRHYAQRGHVDRLRATYTRRLGVRYFFAMYDLDLRPTRWTVLRQEEQPDVPVVPPLGPAKISGRSDVAHRDGQRRLSPHGGGDDLRQGEPNPVLPHPVQHLMAQQNREPLHGAP